jgi:hypothetical protein
MTGDEVPSQTYEEQPATIRYTPPPAPIKVNRKIFRGQLAPERLVFEDAPGKENASGKENAPEKLVVKKPKKNTLGN